MSNHQLPTLDHVREFYEDKTGVFQECLGLWEELRGHDYFFLAHQYALSLEVNPTIPLSKECYELSDYLTDLVDAEIMSQRQVL